MKIKIKCPSCNASNVLSLENQQCRRCKEDLSLLFQIKGHSLKYRIYLLQILNSKEPEMVARKRGLAQAATWLKK